MIVPRPGLAVIRRIKAAQTMPGGRILLTENTRDFLTAGQAELVTIGTAGEPDEDAEGQVYDELSHLASGAWLLLRHRTWIETDEPDLFLVRHEDIIGVLAC
jgi:hypothetical protein